MGDERRQVEARQHQRFEVVDEAFVLLDPDSTKLGAVVDISMGGLSFSHMAIKPLSSELFELDLFLIGQNFYFEKVPYKRVWDLETKEGTSSAGPMRRCGVQFGELTHSQAAQIRHFIQNYTTASMLDPYIEVKNMTQGPQPSYL